MIAVLLIAQGGIMDMVCPGFIIWEDGTPFLPRITSTDKKYSSEELMLVC
jgi:hypothetical protein